MASIDFQVPKLKAHHYLIIILSILLLPITLMIGCGQSTQEATSTTLPVTANSVAILGGSSSAATGLSAKGIKATAVMANADVVIGIPTKDSDALTTIGTGKTDANGSYIITIESTSFNSAKTSNNFAANVMVTISKDGTSIGCVLPSVSLEAGKQNFATTANPGDYKKQKLARAAFKKGSNPTDFDYNTSIDQKFSSDTLKDTNDSDLDKFAASIKSGDDAESEIAAGLGISATVMVQMRQKGMELFKTYVEPILQAAYTSQTPPNKTLLDAANASMEAAMKDYVLGLGLTEQQISDLKSMKNKQIESNMGEQGFGAGDAAFEESKRRMMGEKVVTMFLGQYDAAKTLATIAPTGGVAFSVGQLTAYNRFLASKEVIVAQLNSFMNNASIQPNAIPDYLRTNFFDAYVFPPAADKPAEGDQAGMEQMMQSFTNRIMVYFMQTFLTQDQRNTYFTNQGAMQQIFMNRFNNQSSPYYMGPVFWATHPTPVQIQARLTLFNAALDAAMNDNTALKNIFIAAHFTDAQATTILKAFRILMSPPDAMI